MRAFRFPLQRVLDARKHKEDLRKRQLAAAKEAELAEKERLRLLEQDSKQLRSELGCHVGRVVKASEMAMLYAYSRRLDRDIAQQKEVAGQAAELVAHKREELLISSKEKKVLEKLKEKMWDRHGVEEGREEQAHLDEVAARLYARKA